MVSYAILSLILVYIGLLPLLLGLNPAASSPYSALLGYALVVVSAALVATFFTIPVTLAVFGRAGVWVKHVAIRSAKWLFDAFGAVVLFYLGAGAVSTIEEGLSIGPLFILLVSGVLVIGLVSGGTLVRGAEALFTLASRLSPPATGESRAAVELRLTPPLYRGKSPVHAVVNRNKMRIGPNRKTRKGKAVLREPLQGRTSSSRGSVMAP